MGQVGAEGSQDAAVGRDRDPLMTEGRMEERKDKT